MLQEILHTHVRGIACPSVGTLMKSNLDINDIPTVS